MRRLEPGFSDREGERFRNSFRRWREEYGAINADIGAALGHHKELRGGGAAEGTGARVVVNALNGSRKLTHEKARRLVVALFLAEPARRSERAIDEESAEQREERAHHQHLEYTGYRELVGLLITLGAISGKSPALPVFIGPASADALAQEVSAFIVGNANGIGKPRQPAIRGALLRFFRQKGHQMARAWTDRALQLPTVREWPTARTVAMIANSRDAKPMEAPPMKEQWREVMAGELIEGIYRAEFGDRYIYPSEVASFGPEFELLERERPALTAFLELPPDWKVK
jgi:hypothetical protein